MPTRVPGYPRPRPAPRRNRADLRLRAALLGIAIGLVVSLGCAALGAGLAVAFLEAASRAPLPC